MTDNKQMELDQSQAQAQQQNQNQQSQQMIITTHEMQQNVQQQQAQQQQQSQAQQQNQQQQSNGNQKIQTQVQVQPQVAAIMPQQHDAVAVSMQHQQQQQNVGGVSMTLSGQQGATTITTMAAHPQAVQVIQQPMQNQYHLQQLYNAQGTPLLMQGNLLAHPAGLNSSPIQVQFNNLAGKPFQAGALQAPHMLTTASTGQGGAHPGAGGAKVQGFPAGYIPVPTSATPGGGQTLVFSQLEVLPQHQTSLQQQQQGQQGNNKNDQVQKYTTCTTGAPTGQNRSMQLAASPWQFATPGIWATGIQPQALLTAAPNQIFFRDPSQPDMLFQSPQPIQTHNAIAAQQQIQGVQQIATAGGKPRVMNIQQQQQTNKTGVSQRPLSILPSNVQGVQAANIRPASSVSTQTNHGVQTTVNAQSGKAGGGTGKGRGKPPMVRTSPGPNTITVTKAGGVATSTSVAAAAAASNAQQNAKNAAAVQHNATMIMQAGATQTQAVAASNGNGGAGTNGKMLIATTGTANSIQPPGSPMNAAVGDKSNFGQAQNKQNVMQSQQQQQQAAQAAAAQQQAQAQAQAVAAAQVSQATAAAAAQVQLQNQQQQQQFQQMILQQFHQHQQLQYQQAQQGGPQQIQPKPIMSMTVQQQPVTQSNVVIGPGGERSLMPVVSINPTLIGNQLVSAGPHQLQALPIVGQPGDLQAAAAAAQQMQQAAAVAAAQQQHLQQQQAAQQQSAVSDQAPSMPILMTSPERAQMEVQAGVMPPPPPATPMSVDDKTEKTSTPKKDTVENGDASASSDHKKDENHEASKPDDKTSTNPLINLANAVNSITNGNMEETNVLEPLPTTVNKQAPCKAIVKPQVLTHVIEGFVIQESSEPFPVNRASLNGSMNQENSLRNNSADKENYEEVPNKRRKHSVNHSVDGEYLQDGKCEACGKALDEQNMKLKKDKRYCSPICAKLKKKEIREGIDRQWSDMEVDPKNDIDMIKKNGDDKSLSLNNVSLDDPSSKMNPMKWTVNEVCDFIRNLPDCADYAEDFAIQEIDGQALMLLKENHLMSAMSIKLGPALKIVAKINSMKVESASGASPVSSESN